MNFLTCFGRTALIQIFTLAAGLMLIATESRLRAADAPVSETVIEGARVTLSATADGNPAPTFVWRKNGVAIPGATAATLVFNAITLAEAGTYQVVATNSAGSAVSHDAVLVVQSAPTTPTLVAPTITTQPVANLTAAVGSSATFSVAATGTPTPAYQWYKNGVALSGATGATLTLSALTVNDNATYKVAVANSAGTAVSTDALLTVKEAVVAPTITTQPVDSLTVTVGETATFTVVAAGSPAPTYQWRMNGVDIVGATSSWLSLTGVTADQAGAYTVVVTNSGGSLTSTTALLTVQPLVVTQPQPPPSNPGSSDTYPVFTTQPVSKTVTAGAAVTFTVAVSGSPAPTLQWKKSGVSIVGATGTTFSIGSVNSSDAGVYTAVATNSAGSTTSSQATLTISSTPKFTVVPKGQTVPTGGTLRLTASATGSPAPTYQWQKNGASMAGATSSELVLDKVTSADSAVYTVVASNGSGAVSANAHVVVGGVGVSPPVITVQPLSQSTVLQTTVSFRVAATGSPAPTYQWRKNGIAIGGANSASLVIPKATRSDRGVYTVDVRNAFGEVTSSPAELVVTTASGKVVSSVEDEAGADGGTGVVADANVSRIVNLSVRSSAGSGGDSLIVGFVLSEGAQKPMLVRGIGPTLGAFGVPGALLDPTVALYSGPELTSGNDDWGSSENAAAIALIGSSVGAFSLNETTNDAALVSILRTGAYTAQVSGKGSESGITLIEVYDGASSEAGRLVNVSTRARVGSGADVPNIGFVIEGTQPKKVLLRAVGPTLSLFGVTDVLADPQLELFEGASRLLHNDNWDGSTTLNQAFAQVGAFGLADPLSKDAVLLVTLEPGAYTAVVSGVNGSTGTVLVEVYEVN